MAVPRARLSCLVSSARVSLAAAVVDGAQQPHEIMRAQFGTGGRGTLVPTHTYDRAIPVSRGGYQSQWKPTAVCSARRR